MGNYTRRTYHSEQPAWRDSDNLNGKYIGVEFECEPKGTDSYRKVLDLLPDFKFGRSPLTESDMSLGPNGVEIIFPPVSYKQLKNKKSVFAKSIAALQDNLKDTTRTGMHLNVNTRGWSLQHKEIFVSVFHHISQCALEAIGGRKLNSYCSQHRFQRLREASYYSGHQYAAEWRSNRVELRFPKPTTDHEHIKKLVEFIEMAEHFAKLKRNPMPTSTANLEQKFKKYLRGSKKGKQVLGYLYGTSTDSNSTAEPAISISTNTAASAETYTSSAPVIDNSSTPIQGRDQLGEFLRSFRNITFYDPSELPTISISSG